MKSDTQLVQGDLGLLWAQLLFSWLVGTGHFSASWSQQLGDLCAVLEASLSACDRPTEHTGRLQGWDPGPSPPQRGPLVLWPSPRSCGGLGTPS